MIVANCANENFDDLFEKQPELFLFIVSDLPALTNKVASRPDVFYNPLSVMWWPQKESISEIDLIQCALEGFDYLPNERFANQIWLAKIKGRLIANGAIQGYYQRDMYTDDAYSVPQNQDLDLTTQIVDYLNKNNLDETFSIEKMGNELGMSRTKFFNEVKASTGLSPSRLVMNYRLRKAARLLESKRTQISEIAFEVGFSSTAYFTKCFKDLFGKSPSQFVKAVEQSNMIKHVKIEHINSLLAV